MTAPPSTAPSGYDRTSRLLHWLVAAAFLGALGLGLALGNLELAREARAVLLDPHKALGLVVLAFGTWRVARRLRRSFPAPAAPGPRWREAAAKAVHGALLAAILVMPLSGVAMTLARGRALEVAGVTLLPAIGETPWLAAAAGTAHALAGPLVLGLLALHVGAALKHHFVDRDATLLRMTTGVRTRRGRAAGSA